MSSPVVRSLSLLLFFFVALSSRMLLLLITLCLHLLLLCEQRTFLLLFDFRFALCLFFGLSLCLFGSGGLFIVLIIVSYSRGEEGYSCISCSVVAKEKSAKRPPKKRERKREIISAMYSSLSDPYLLEPSRLVSLPLGQRYAQAPLVLSPPAITT